MARGRIDVNNRPNTLKQNKMVLCELRSRNKIELRTSHELNKLFAKLNLDNAPKHWKNVKSSVCGKQDKVAADQSYGPVEGFPPGSWWGIRMDCSRDGVHVPFDSDIQDGSAGAISLCTSHLNNHDDEDLGDSLTYTGDIYESGVRSDHPLIRSYRSQVPLRLVRSYNLTNEFAPKTGYRYDGLYSVAACWIGVSSNTEKYYKFALIRVPNQEPPAWNESIVPANDPIGRKKKSTAERFSTNLCVESHSAIDDYDPANNCRGRAETIKYCHNKSTNVDRMAKESKRNVQDSTIVTRCISTKKSECPPGIGMHFVPGIDASSQNPHRILEKPSKPSNFKLQNTNISIRTDLYDSSHNIQQDAKRSVPMSFCRTFVTARSNRGINHSNVGTLNLNTCGPCPRDGEQESLIQSRSGINKMTSIHPSSFNDHHGINDNRTPKINSTSSPVETKMRLEMVNDRFSDNVGNLDSSNLDSNDLGKEKLSIDEKRQEKNSTSTRNHGTNDKMAGNNEISLPIDNPNNENVRESGKKNVKNLEQKEKEEMMKEQRLAIDSLTPEQMLKYIVERKYHPTGKLLIGSVIGLATGESKILRTYDSLVTRKNNWNENLTKLRDESTTSSTNEETYVRTRSKSFNAMNKDRVNVKSSSNKKRSMKDNRLFTMRLRRTRMSKRLVHDEKKSNANDSKNSTNVKSKLLQKIQQPFSKSTCRKNSKKCGKKRRSELANLAIDAKIGPKIRGPRNRRLRCRNNLFTMKHRDNDVANCCAEKNSRIVVRSDGKNLNRESSSKREKSLKSATKSRLRKSRFIDRKKISQKNAETTIVQRETTKIGDSSASQNDLKIVAGKLEKRKMEKMENVNRNGKKCCRRDDDDQTIMVDVGTQCSNVKNRSIVNDDTDESVKIEWIDVDDVKSESWTSDDDRYELTRVDDSCTIDANRFDRENLENRLRSAIDDRSVRSKSFKNSQTTSAFVPVNISNNDFRIARLRSIGFRPICQSDRLENNSSLENVSGNKTVVDRIADEEYNRYTSEETTIVGYMDQQLRYQDVEEDATTMRRRVESSKVEKIVERSIEDREEKLEIVEIVKIEGSRRNENVGSVDDDSEKPWHGWKKFVENEESHWVGW